MVGIAAGYVDSYTTTCLPSYCYVSDLIPLHMCPHRERQRAAGGAQVPAAGVGAEAYEERADADEEGPRRLGRIAARALCVPQQAIPPPPLSCELFFAHSPVRAAAGEDYVDIYIC
jgi:hypothetical protein